MNIITRLEAQFKTLDKDNPILFNIEDFVLAMQRLGIEAFGADTIACYEGNVPIDSKFTQERHHFAIRSKVNGHWKRLMIVCVFGEWENDWKITAYKITENKC